MVFEKFHSVPELRPVEFLRPAFPVPLFRPGYSPAFLCPLDDHITFKLGEGKQDVSHENRYAAIVQNAEIQDVDGNSSVNQICDQLRRLRIVRTSSFA